MPLEKKLNYVAYLVSLIVLVLVLLMRKVKISTEIDFSFLPPFHATVNGIVAVLLLLALYFIKQKKVNHHRNTIVAAVVLSVIFLMSYVVYHFTTEETLYCKTGAIRMVYFFFLITHIILAGISLPLILLTLIRAYVGSFERHKRMAKWVWPIWFYVAVTGPVCYWMLSPCY
ncbi:MAG TPA: DUF420 domain-containing protein [Saprospiraceae bacterium]|nr:DUF420 domain-containing protein [Saprospiraceae bacterium]